MRFHRWKKKNVSSCNFWTWLNTWEKQFSMPRTLSNICRIGNMLLEKWHGYLNVPCFHPPKTFRCGRKTTDHRSCMHPKCDFGTKLLSLSRTRDPLHSYDEHVGTDFLDFVVICLWVVVPVSNVSLPWLVLLSNRFYYRFAPHVLERTIDTVQ